MLRPSRQITFDGRPLRGGPEAAARAGIAHVPEGRGTFTELTVTENLSLGGLYTRVARRQGGHDRVATWFPGLLARREQPAGTALRRRTADARARPRPDVPSPAAPARRALPRPRPDVVRWIVRELNEKEGLTVLVVEQDARIALDAASTANGAQVGRAAVSGPSAELRDDEAIRRSYLGY